MIKFRLLVFPYLFKLCLRLIFPPWISNATVSLFTLFGCFSMIFQVKRMKDLPLGVFFTNHEGDVLRVSGDTSGSFHLNFDETMICGP